MEMSTYEGMVQKLYVERDDTEPVVWMNRYGATMKTRDRASANAMGFTTPLYARPLRNEWREAVHDELVTTQTLSAENKDDPRKALQDIINWHVCVALDPKVSSDAQALVDYGRANPVPTCEWCGENPAALLHSCPRADDIALGSGYCNCCPSCAERCTGYF